MYTLFYNPLRLVQWVNGIKTLTIFDQNSLYVEKTTGLHNDVCEPIIYDAFLEYISKD